MAEDIKDETTQEQETEQNEEVSNEGVIAEEDNTNEEAQNSDIDESNTTSSQEDSSMSEQVDESPMEEESLPEHSVQKKQSKLQKILIITIGVLLSILILGFVLYLFGVFDPEPQENVNDISTMENNQTKKPEKYIFDSKDINIDRLNGKLRILTKYEIIGTEQEERQKELEKNSKLSTKQINELLQSEKDMRTKKQNETLKDSQMEEKITPTQNQNVQEEKKENPYDLLKFIQVSTNEQSLATIKPQLDTLKTSISKCQDRSQSFLLIGPFKSNKELNSIYRDIYTNITQSATKKDLARLEFNRICK